MSLLHVREANIDIAELHVNSDDLGEHVLGEVGKNILDISTISPIAAAWGSNWSSDTRCIVMCRGVAGGVQATAPRAEGGDTRWLGRRTGEREGGACGRRERNT